MDITKKIFQIEPLKLRNYITGFIHNSNELINKIKTNMELTNKQKIKLLIEDTFVYNLLVQHVLLGKILNYNTDNYKYWTESDMQLLKHNINFNSDPELFEIIKELIKTSIEIGDKIFLNKMGRRMQMHGTEVNKCVEINKIIETINTTENIITSIVEKKFKFQIDRKNIDANTETIMSSVYPDTNNIVELTKNKYYYLIKKINDHNLRLFLETQYNTRYSIVTDSLNKLVSLRYLYATKIGVDNYISLVSNKTKEDLEVITHVLFELDKIINTKLNSILLDIKTSIKINRKMTTSDLIYGLNKTLPDVKIKPVEMLQISFYILQKYFNVKFIKSTNMKYTSLFNVSCFEIYDENNKLLNILYLDLLKDSNKQIKQLTLIKLCNTYNNNIGMQYLIGNYIELDNKQCNFSELIIFVREFGNILTNIYATTKLTGISENDNEMISFVPDLLEHFIYTEPILNFITNTSTHIKQFEKYRQYELIINTKLNCVNSLFDNIIHKQFDIKTNETHNVLTIYKEIYKESFESVHNILETNISHITPQIINNIINDNAGVCYSTIINTMLSYTCFVMILNNYNEKFINTVLKNSNFSFKESVKEFIKLSNINNFDMFINNALKINIKTEKDNYFEETETQCE